MKRIVAIAVLAVVALASCKKDEFRLDPNSTVNIRGKMVLKSTEIPAEVKFVAKYARGYLCYSESLGKGGIGRGFASDQRDDSVQYLLKWKGTDVIREYDGVYYLGITLYDYKDYFIVANFDKNDRPIDPDTYIPGQCAYSDTIAYMPNEVVMRAKKEISEAFAARDYNRCYQLFDSAYVFVPKIKDKWRRYVDELR